MLRACGWGSSGIGSVTGGALTAAIIILAAAVVCRPRARRRIASRRTPPRVSSAPMRIPPRATPPTRSTSPARRAPTRSPAPDSSFPAPPTASPHRRPRSSWEPRWARTRRGASPATTAAAARGPSSPQVQKIFCGNLASDPGSIPIIDNCFMHADLGGCPTPAQVRSDAPTFHRRIDEMAAATAAGRPSTCWRSMPWGPPAGHRESVQPTGPRPGTEGHDAHRLRPRRRLAVDTSARQQQRLRRRSPRRDVLAAEGRGAGRAGQPAPRAVVPQPALLTGGPQHLGGDLPGGTGLGQRGRGTAHQRQPAGITEQSAHFRGEAGG
jgi:hypothetical protein